MKTVAIDCDGVLVDVHSVIEEAWRRAGLPYRIEDVTCFRFVDCVGPQAHEIAWKVFEQPTLYDTLTPMPYALDALADLRRTYRVITISAPVAQHAGSKFQFLQTLGFNKDDIFLAADKPQIRADLLVDDRAETVEVWPAAAILYDRPWNRRSKFPYRAWDWHDVPRLVRELL